MAIDTAALVTPVFLLLRRLRVVACPLHIAVPAAIQMAYFTISVATTGGYPGQLIAGLRVVDMATGARPGWSKSAQRWMVWAAPGIATRSIILASRSVTKKRAAALGEEQRRIVAEFDDQEDELVHRRLLALQTGRKAAPIWAPPAITTALLVLYEISIGRGAQDSLTGTYIVRTLGADS